MPTSGVMTGSAPLPSQSQETDMLRITLMKASWPAKWVIVALVLSVMRSMNSSLAMSHWSSEPGVVWISALPMRPSAQPMPMFLLEPPKPPWVWPLKWVRARKES